MEELKRLLETLRKLNQDSPEMAQAMEELEKNQLLQSLRQNMQQSQQGMEAGQKQQAAPFAFRARQEAEQLADLTRKSQSQMQSQQNDQAVQMLVIVGAACDGFLEDRRVGRDAEHPVVDQRLQIARGKE